MAEVARATAAQARTSGRPGLRGELLPVERCPGLAAEWTALAQAAECSPFSSWEWVSTWLEQLPREVKPLLFRAHDADGVAALALLVDRGEQGAGRWFGRRSWYLQETGDPELDEITVEYAGLLARPEALDDGYRALFEALARLPPDWRRLRISTSAHGPAIAAALPAGLHAASVESRPCHRVDLDAVRAADGGYAALLGRSTRSTLRQTLRAYEALGPLRVDTAHDPAQALAWFEAFEALHTASWRSRGRAGCFASPFFGRFHRRLLAGTAASGFARLCRVRAGDALVGYLYNLCWQGRLYFYNAGLNYGLLDRHDRPGIAALHTAVDDAAAQGLAAFDFLAGDQDYKRRLATSEATLHSIDIRRDGMRASAERLGAGLVRRAAPAVPLARALTTTSQPPAARE